MKYKVGDKVIIRTWEDMASQYGEEEEEGEIHIPKNNSFFIKEMEEEINKISLDRILTIQIVCSDYYDMKEIEWGWTDEMIKCLAEDYIEPISITNRFEILDL